MSHRTRNTPLLTSSHHSSITRDYPDAMAVRCTASRIIHQLPFAAASYSAILGFFIFIIAAITLSLTS